jgi:hypothetical protein
MKFYDPELTDDYANDYMDMMSDLLAELVSTETTTDDDSYSSIDNDASTEQRFINLSSDTNIEDILTLVQSDFTVNYIHLHPDSEYITTLVMTGIVEFRAWNEDTRNGLALERYFFTKLGLMLLDHFGWLDQWVMSYKGIIPFPAISVAEEIILGWMRETRFNLSFPFFSSDRLMIKESLYGLWCSNGNNGSYWRLIGTNNQGDRMDNKQAALSLVDKGILEVGGIEGNASTGETNNWYVISNRYYSNFCFNTFMLAEQRYTRVTVNQ